MGPKPVPAPLSTTNEATPSKGGRAFFGGIRGRRSVISTSIMFTALARAGALRALMLTLEQRPAKGRRHGGSGLECARALCGHQGAEADAPGIAVTIKQQRHHNQCSYKGYVGEACLCPLASKRKSGSSCPAGESSAAGRPVRGLPDAPGAPARFSSGRPLWDGQEENRQPGKCRCKPFVPLAGSRWGEILFFLSPQPGGRLCSPRGAQKWSFWGLSTLKH